MILRNDRRWQACGSVVRRRLRNSSFLHFSAIPIFLSNSNNNAALVMVYNKILFYGKRRTNAMLSTRQWPSATYYGIGFNLENALKKLSFKYIYMKNFEK